MAGYVTISTLTVGTTPLQLASVTGANYVYVKSIIGNTGNIYVNTQRNLESPGSGNGMQISPNGGYGFEVTDSGKIWIVSDTAGQIVDVTYGINSRINYSAGSSAVATSGGILDATGTIGATATAIKSTAGQLYGWYIFNSNGSTVYCQIFDLAAGSVSLGSTAPTLSFGIPAGSGANILGAKGIQFSNAITIAFTTTRSGGSAPASTVDYNFFYI